MKEVTYEDWQKNPTPRMMWVWDSKVNVYFYGKETDLVEKAEQFLRELKE